jgi:hypothetical protein
MAAPAQATHSWADYHWGRSSDAFMVQLGDNLHASWDPYLSRTSRDWSSAGQPLTTQVGPGTTSGKRCQPTPDRVEVCDAAYGKNGWLGLASVWLNGNHITQGTAKVNDTYFALDRYNNRGERLHVLCQEVGHTFGLGHTSEDGMSQATCMDYSRSSDSDIDATLTTAGSSVTPNGHDFEQLTSLYSHLDSTATVSASSGSTSGLQPSEDQASWGREVAHGRDGAWSVFVREGRSGQRLVTHVTWGGRGARQARPRRPRRRALTYERLDVSALSWSASTGGERARTGQPGRTCPRSTRPAPADPEPAGTAERGASSARQFGDDDRAGGRPSRGCAHDSDRCGDRPLLRRLLHGR